MHCGCSVIRKSFSEKKKPQIRWWNTKCCQQPWNQQDLPFWAQWDPQTRAELPGWFSAPRISNQNLLFFLGVLLSEQLDNPNTSSLFFVLWCENAGGESPDGSGRSRSNQPAVFSGLLGWLNLCKGLQRECSSMGWHETKYKEPNKLLFPPNSGKDTRGGDINWNKNKAPESETAGRKKFRRKRIKQLKDFKKYNYRNNLKLTKNSVRTELIATNYNFLH